MGAHTDRQTPTMSAAGLPPCGIDGPSETAHQSLSLMVITYELSPGDTGILRMPGLTAKLLE